MKIIILAAGRGSRLGKLTANTPKALIDLGDGKTLLETHLKNIEDSGVIDEIVLVVGYCGEQIEAKIKKYQKEGMKIRTIYNPFYSISNNLMTLFLAKHEMNEDFIITNGDNIIEAEILRDLVQKNDQGIFLTIDQKKKYYKDDMKVTLNDGGIECVSKNIPEEKINGESIGLALISGEKYLDIFKENLEELVKDEENINSFWLNVFNKIVKRGGRITPFEIDARKWKEVDIHMDVKDLLELLHKNKLESLSPEGAEKEPSQKDSNNIEKKPAIMVCGLLSTGKTTFSKFLINKLNDYTRFNTDDVRRILGCEKFDRKDTPRVNEYMYSNARELLSKGKGVMFDSAYKLGVARQKVYDLAKECNVPILVIQTICSHETAKKRIVKRPSKDGLHTPTNKINDYEEYVKLWENISSELKDPKNTHVSYATFNSETNQIEETSVKDDSKDIINQIKHIIDIL